MMFLPDDILTGISLSEQGLANWGHGFQDAGVGSQQSGVTAIYEVVEVGNGDAVVFFIGPGMCAVRDCFGEE